MSNAVTFVSYNLKKNVSVPDFLLAADKMASEFTSKQKGLISSKLLVNEKMWADLLIWETMEDAQNNAAACETSAAVCEYLACIDSKKENHLQAHFSVEKSYSDNQCGITPNAIEFSYYNLKKGASVSDFLRVSDKFNNEFLTAQKGYISRKLLVDGDMWADFVSWETMEDILNAFSVAPKDAAASEFLSFIALNKCKSRLLSVERSYSIVKGDIL